MLAGVVSLSGIGRASRSYDGKWQVDRLENRHLNDVGSFVQSQRLTNAETVVMPPGKRILKLLIVSFSRWGIHFHTVSFPRYSIECGPNLEQSVYRHQM